MTHFLVRFITAALVSELIEAHDVRNGGSVLALQQVVDSFVAGLLTDEAFCWLTAASRSDSGG